MSRQATANSLEWIESIQINAIEIGSEVDNSMAPLFPWLALFIFVRYLFCFPIHVVPACIQEHLYTWLLFYVSQTNFSYLPLSRSVVYGSCSKIYIAILVIGKVFRLHLFFTYLGISITTVLQNDLYTTKNHCQSHAKRFIAHISYS